MMPTSDPLEPVPALRGAERAARTLLLGAIVPLWTAAGSIDYVLHRRSQIERTTGSHESGLHVIGIALSTLPVLAGLLAEINAGVLLIMGVGYLTHAGMTIADVAYADTRRTIVPFEQHVHGMLELLPFTALALVVCTNHEQALALIGQGNARPEYSLKKKRTPISRRVLVGTVAAFTLFVALPFAEEFVRCVRYERGANS